MLKSWQGCEHIGWIEVDMSLKHEGLFELKQAPGGCDSEYYYEVEFDLVMKVKDRDLQCNCCSHLLSTLFQPLFELML